jgi:uncharacterized membrane-anchored protein YitT (DUF2179 family)
MDDGLLSAVFRGVIAVAGVGVIIRYYSSTGGFDVVGLVLIKKWDVHVPLGGLIFALNSGVVAVLGFFSLGILHFIQRGFVYLKIYRKTPQKYNRVLIRRSF